MDIDRPSKAPDKIGPPLTYMEERGVFKPLYTIANTLGLCRFYQTDPKKSNVITGLKSTASTCKIKCLLKLAKELGWLLTVVVFEGGTVTPLGLLQELHSRSTLSSITIHMPEEVKVGPKNCVSCCPICVYVVKNDYLFLNHIIIGHYWSNFSCGKCLEFVASIRQQMKRHLPDCGDPKKVCKKKCSKGGKVARHLRCKAVQNLATSPRRARKTKQTRKTGVAWERKSRANHHPSLPVQLLLKNKLQALFSESECLPMHVLSKASLFWR